MSEQVDVNEILAAALANSLAYVTNERTREQGFSALDAFYAARDGAKEHVRRAALEEIAEAARVIEATKYLSDGDSWNRCGVAEGALRDALARLDGVS